MKYGIKDVANFIVFNRLTNEVLMFDGFGEEITEEVNKLMKLKKKAKRKRLKKKINKKINVLLKLDRK